MDTLARLRLDKENDIRQSKDNHNKRWIAKVKTSPYSIDLVAVRERALSEQKSKSSKQKSPSVDNDGRKEKAKNDVFSTVSYSI